MVNKFLELLSTSSSTGDWEGNLPYIIPDYLTGPFVNPNEDHPYNRLLLTQVNVESFGDLYKVTYEIKYSVPGWHPAVYNEAGEPE